MVANGEEYDLTQKVFLAEKKCRLLQNVMYFTPVLWPDFSSEELEKAVFWFTGRDRRFGGLTEASR